MASKLEEALKADETPYGRGVYRKNNGCEALDTIKEAARDMLLLAKARQDATPGKRAFGDAFSDNGEYSHSVMVECDGGHEIAQFLSGHDAAFSTLSANTAAKWGSND